MCSSLLMEDNLPGRLQAQACPYKPLLSISSNAVSLVLENYTRHGELAIIGNLENIVKDLHGLFLLS